MAHYTPFDFQRFRGAGKKALPQVAAPRLRPPPPKANLLGKEIEQHLNSPTSGYQHLLSLLAVHVKGFMVQSLEKPFEQNTECCPASGEDLPSLSPSLLTSAAVPDHPPLPMSFG